MTAARSFWPVVGLLLTVAHIALGVGICWLAYWLYFDLGFVWTPDPTVPQIEGILAMTGQTIAALIFVPAGLLTRKHSRYGLPVAIAWPLAYAIIPFALPHIFAWLCAAIGLFTLGLLLLRRRKSVANS